MDIGYFAMPLHSPDRAIADVIEYNLMQLEVLDQLGYTEAWFGEHSLARWEPITSPDLLIAAALQRTRTMRLGTGVSCLPHHHPLRLAQQIAFLDQLAHGRFNWGIGTSGYDESTTWGVDSASGEHRTLFLDVLEEVLSIWDDPEPGVRDHPHFTYRVPEPGPLNALRVRPYQLPHPPIGVACISPRSESLVLAGQNGWMPMSISLARIGGLCANWETYEEAAAAAGRTADRALWRVSREVHVAPTSAQARKEALTGPIARSWREHFLPTALKYGVPLSAIIGPDLELTFEDDVETILEHICDELWVVGDPDEVTEKLNGLFEAVGGFGTLLVIAQDWEEDPAWERSVNLLAEVVKPQLADLAVGAGT